MSFILFLTVLHFFKREVETITRTSFKPETKNFAYFLLISSGSSLFHTFVTHFHFQLFPFYISNLSLLTKSSFLLVLILKHSTITQFVPIQKVDGSTISLLKACVNPLLTLRGQREHDLRQICVKPYFTWGHYT